MAAPHPESSWYLTTATDKNSSQISGPKLQQGLAINKKPYSEILQYCASEINKASSGRLPASEPVRNGVKRTVFDLLDTKYGHVFKRSDLPLEFEAFAVAAKKPIWRHVTTNRRGGVEVRMADVQKRGALSSREQSVGSSRSRATSEAAQVLGGLSIKAPRQPDTTPTPFYEMSFAVYSYPDKTPFTGAPIPYGFALKTEHEHLLSDSPEKFNAYHCGYNKLQAAMSENFSADEYSDGRTIVDLTTGTPILNHMNLEFTVLSAKKAGLDIIMIGVKDPNRITKRTRFNEGNSGSDSDPDIARPVSIRRRTGTPAPGRSSHEQSTPESTPPIPAGASSAVRPATIKTARSRTCGSKDRPLLDVPPAYGF